MKTKMFTLKINCRLSTIALALVALMTSKTFAQKRFVDFAMMKVAKSISSTLKDEGLKNEITVGEFVGPPSLKTSGGREVSRVLAEQLKKAGVEVKDDAAQQLTGSFHLFREKEHVDDDFLSVGMKIEVKILDAGAFGEEIQEISIKYFGEQVLQIGGVDVDLPANDSPDVRQKKIVEQTKAPLVSLVGNETRSAKASDFGVEIQVAEPRGRSPRKPRLDHSGKSFVELNRGEEYQVILHNRADYKVAVSLNIDGVNMFVDAKDTGKKSRVIINPKSSVRIQGWFITSSKTKAFEISGYQNSVASRVGQGHNVGTVTATFRACWKKGTVRPVDEPGGVPKGGDSRKATTQGRDIEDNYVRLKNLEFGAIRSIVNVRYDR